MTGLVDAVSYLALGRVFVANMTGNVVFLGFALKPGTGLSPLAAVVAVAGFLAGALGGGRLGHDLVDRPARWLGTALGAQAAALAVIAVLAGLGVLPYTGRPRLVLVAALAVTFGWQNATVRRLGAADLTTTVLTLTLTGLAADNVVAGGPGAKAHRRLGSVLAMLGGAAVGATLLRTTVAGVIGLAAAGVATVAVILSGTMPDRLPQADS